MWRRQCQDRLAFITSSLVASTTGSSRTTTRHVHQHIDTVRCSSEDGDTDVDVFPGGSSGSASSRSADTTAFIREQLHTRLLSLAHAATRQPHTTAFSSSAPASHKQASRQNVPSVVVDTKAGTEKDEPQEAFAPSPSRLLASSTGQKGVNPEGELLKRLLLAKRKARLRTANRSPHAVVSPQAQGTHSPSASPPLQESTPTVPAAHTDSSAAWQEALRLFFDAVHNHAVTPTAQHFRLLLELTTHDRAWQAVDHVEAYYARFLASLSELRAGKAQDLAQLHKEMKDDALAQHEREEEAGEATQQQHAESGGDDVRGGETEAHWLPSEADQHTSSVAALRRQLGDLESVEETLRPNTPIFHVLMRAALARRRWPLVLEYFDNMREAGLVLTDDTLQYVLEALWVRTVSTQSPVLQNSVPPGPRGHLSGMATRDANRVGEEAQEDASACTAEALWSPPPVRNEASPLQAVLQSTQYREDFTRGALGDTRTRQSQRLATNQRGPQLRRAAQPAPSRAEHAQAEQQRRQAEHGADMVRNSADVAFTLVRDYCHIVTQPRTVWLAVAIVQNVHTEESSRRLVSLYHLFPHLLGPAQLVSSLQHASFHETHARLLHSTASPTTAGRSTTDALVTGAVHSRAAQSVSWRSPPPGALRLNGASSSVLAELWQACSAQYVGWIWLGVSAAARDLGDWVVAQEIWGLAVQCWRAGVEVSGGQGATLSFRASAAGVGGGEGGGALAQTRQGFLIEVVQPLLVSALHTLRRVRRYADILSVFQQHYLPLLNELESCTTRNFDTATQRESPYLLHAEAALFWSPAALVLVAQAATALQRIDVLRLLIRVEARVLAHAHPSQLPVVPLPPDVYESALRAHQVQRVLERQESETQGGKRHNTDKTSHTAAGPSASTAHDIAEMNARAPLIYKAYLDAAKGQFLHRQDDPACDLHRCPLLAPEYEPLLRTLFSLLSPSSLSSPLDASAHRGHKALWQDATEHFNLIRRPDALHVILVADVLCTTARQARAVAAHAAPASISAVGEAARGVLQRLLADLPPEIVMDISSSSPASWASWQSDPMSFPRARLAARLARAHVSELAVERLLTAVILSRQPFDVFTLIRHVTAMAWLTQAAAERLWHHAQQEALEKTRADLRRAQHEEQQLNVLPGMARPTKTTAPLHATPGPASVQDREGGHPTSLLMTMASQSAVMSTPQDENKLLDKESAAVIASLHRLLACAVGLLQQLQSTTATPTAAFDALLDAVADVHTAQTKQHATHRISPSSLLGQGALSPLLVLPVVVDAVLEQVNVSTPHRCTLWPHCVQLLTQTLISPFASSPLSPSAVRDAKKVLAWRAFVSPATLSLLRRFIRYCDRAESGFVEAVALEWLRPDSLRLVVLDDDEAHLQHVEGWDLALEAVVWACRRREKTLAKRIYAVVHPHAHVHSTMKTTSYARDTEKRLAQHLIAARLALLQCLTSGKHEDVLADWPVIHALLSEMIQLNAEGAAARATHADLSQCVLLTSSELLTLADALTAVVGKLTKTLHHLLTRISLDTHRLRWSSTSRSVAARTPHQHKRLHPDADAVARVEAMAQDLLTLLGPAISGGDDAPQIRTDTHTVSTAPPVTPPHHPRLLTDVLLPLSMLNWSHRDTLRIHGTIQRALLSACDVLYTEYVWLACFKFGEPRDAKSGVHRWHSSEGAVQQSEEQQVEQQRRLMRIHQRLTRLLQLHVAFSPASGQTDADEEEEPWRGLRDLLTVWAVVSVHNSVALPASPGADPQKRATQNTMATATARLCSHLITLEAFLGARAVSRPDGLAVSSVDLSRSGKRRMGKAAVATHTRNITVLFLEVVRDLTDAVVALSSTRSSTGKGSADAGLSSAASVSALPPMADGSPALDRFRRPVSLLSASPKALGILHDAGLHLLYMALCEASIPRAVLLHPGLSGTTAASRHRHHVSSQRPTKTPAVPVEEAGLLPSALAWCCGGQTSRYADVLSAGASLLPEIAAACCLVSRGHRRGVPASHTVSTPTTPAATTLHKTCADDANSSEEPCERHTVELLSVVFDRIATLLEWTRAHAVRHADEQIEAQAETLVAVLLTAPQDLYGVDVHVGGRLLSEGTAASALVALSVQVTRVSDGALSSTTKITRSSRLAQREAEALIRAFPRVVVGVLMPRWQADALTESQVSSMDALCAALWSWAKASPAVHRAVLAWSLVVHGTWPSASGLCASRLTTASDLSVFNLLERTAESSGGVVGPHDQRAAVTAVRDALPLLMVDIFGRLRAPLETFLDDRRRRRQTCGRPLVPFVWQNWQRSLSAPGPCEQSRPPPSLVSDTTSDEARFKRCMSPAATAQLLDFAFYPDTASSSPRMCPWLPPVLDQVVAHAGERLPLARIQSIRSVNEARQERARAADTLPSQQQPVTMRTEAASGEGSDGVLGGPVATLVQALVFAVAEMHALPRSGDAESRPRVALHALREHIRRSAASDAVTDWASFHHALHFSASSSTKWHGDLHQDEHDALSCPRVVLSSDHLVLLTWAAMVIEKDLFQAMMPQQQRQSVLPPDGDDLTKGKDGSSDGGDDASRVRAARVDDLCHFSHALFLALDLVEAAPAAHLPLTLLQTYTTLYRPALLHSRGTDVGTAWVWFVLHHVRPLFFLGLSRQALARDAASPSQQASFMNVWGCLLHAIAIDLVALELQGTTAEPKPIRADSAQRHMSLEDARAALVEIQSRWASRFGVVSTLTEGENGPVFGSHALRSWAALSLILGTWRDALHVFKALVAIASTHTPVPEEWTRRVVAVAMLVVCAGSTQGSLTPSVFHELLQGVRRVASTTAEGEETAEETAEAVIVSLSQTLQQSIAAQKTRTDVSASAIACGSVLLAPFAHVGHATRRHPALRDAFFHMFVSGDDQAKAAWDALMHKEALPLQPARTHASPSVETCHGWRKVALAIKALENASEDALRRFVASQSRFQSSSRRSHSKAHPNMVSNKAGHEVTALCVSDAWPALMEGLAEAALASDGSPIERAPAATAIGADVLRVLTLPSLAIIPHTVHFVPLRLSESLVQVACDTWQDGMRLLRFSLTTLRKTHGRPTAVQQYMAFLILQRLRLDVLFADQVDQCKCPWPPSLLSSTEAETRTVHGAAALAVTCFDLVALQPVELADGAGNEARLGGPASHPLLPQRVLVEILRHAATDLPLTVRLYDVLWCQPYKRLEGPHAFLTLLRAARLARRGDVGLQAMTDFLAIVGASHASAEVVSSPSVLPAPSETVVMWLTRVPVTVMSTEAHRVVWRSFAQLCQARLVSPEAAQEVLRRFRTTGMLTEVEELLVTVSTIHASPARDPEMGRADSRPSW